MNEQHAVRPPAEPDPRTGQPIGLPVDATPADRPGPVVLHGRFGRLERLDGAHLDALWAVYDGHPEVWTYISAYGPYDDKDVFIAQMRERITLDDPYPYAILDISGRPVGFITLLNIRPAMRAIEVGHVTYSPTLMRTPLGTEAQYLLARYAFESLRYRRYEWKCNALNEPSRRAALRYGFAYEGTFRQHIIAKGRNRDDAWFSMLDSEWPDRKAAFERWLDPSNFDTDGRQLSSLASMHDAPAARHEEHSRHAGDV